MPRLHPQPVEGEGDEEEGEEEEGEEEETDDEDNREWEKRNLCIDCFSVQHLIPGVTNPSLSHPPTDL